MISLFSTIVALSYESKLHLTKILNIVIICLLLSSVITLLYLVMAKLCNAFVVFADLSVAVTIFILILRKHRSK